MIVLDCEQGSQAWIDARLGIPTASEFSRIVTPTGRASTAAEGYTAELIAEWALGHPVKEFGGNPNTDHGKALEPDARAFYALDTNIDPQTVGFVYQDERKMVGCSPDALVGELGVLELKCPRADTHLLWLARDAIPKDHVIQVQGHIWVTGRSWCDFQSYYPGFPSLLKRAEPDDKLQSALDKIMPEFIADLLTARDRLRAMGVPIASDRPPEPLDSIEELVGANPWRDE